MPYLHSSCLNLLGHITILSSGIILDGVVSSLDYWQNIAASRCGISDLCNPDLGMLKAAGAMVQGIKTWLLVLSEQP